MRAFASALAVAAVAAVGAAAAVDAFRGGADRLPDGLAGELVYSDPACGRHALRLPDLARRDFLTVGCGVFTRTDNLGVKDGDVAWFAYPVPGGTTTLLSRGELPDGTGVRTVAWLGGRRFAAVLDPGRRVAVFQGAARLAVVRKGRFTELRASPSQRYFAALEPGRIAVLDRDGTALWATSGRAIAWSPDERYAAVARPDEVVILRAGGGPPVARLRLAAVDIDWRRLAP